MHSVLEGLDPRPMCISSLNLSKWVKIISRTFSRSLLLLNTNVSLSTYIMQNNSKTFSELKDFGLWLTICSVERGDFLCLKNMALVRPFFVHYFSIVLSNFMMRNMKKTGFMLSPCLTNSSKGVEVSIFQLLFLL